MKFAIRDDDLNYFFNPEDIENNYKDIWDICPISMSVVPFIKGNWPYWVEQFEKTGPGIISEELIEKIYSDDKIHPIGDNEKLVTFLKEEIKRKHIYLTLHAIHHRNEDSEIPQFSTNYGVGAEFYTTRDLTIEVKKSINYLEKLFGQKIEVFAPPQNLLNEKGAKAILNNDLAIVSNYPSIKKTRTIKQLGVEEYFKYLFFKLKNRNKPYPYPLVNNKIKLINHYSLQPGTNIEHLYQKLDNVYKNNGVFVLSTHSYAFSYKMKYVNKTMKQLVNEIVEFVANKKNTHFVSINKVFIN